MQSAIRSLHSFLARHAFYALMLASILACGILAARIIRTHERTYIFLLWNLFLAWIPYMLSLAVAAIQRYHPRDWWRLVIPSGLWLLFFPNAPYIVTDFVHLYERWPVPIWFDIGMLAAFALGGCFLAVVSLRIMQRAVHQLFGKIVSWLFVGMSVGLSGLGVYMGRFLRWNSWDLLFYPRDVLKDALRPLLYPLNHIQPLAISAMFAALLLVCYVMFISHTNDERV